jgi:hypothetical protein
MPGLEGAGDILFLRPGTWACVNPKTKYVDGMFAYKPAKKKQLNCCLGSDTVFAEVEQKGERK